MKYQRIVRTFVASPGDTAGERTALSQVVDEFNLTWADFIGVRLDLLKWETHSWPAAGPDPQAIVNRQIADDYEIFVGILRDHLGTPTPRAPSGTVEEFERALERYRMSGVPEIMFYLHGDTEQHAVLTAFRKRLQSLGILYWPYANQRQFEQACRIHLSKQIQQLARTDRRRPVELRVFPESDQVDVAMALRSITPLLANVEQAAQDYGETNGILTTLTHGLGLKMREASRSLNRIGRAGFRQRPGERVRIIRGLARDLEAYSQEVETLRPDLMDSYRRLVGNYGNALGILAPLHPLPVLFRAPVESTHTRITELQNAVSVLRSSAESARQAIAGWAKVDIRDFDLAKRHTLVALDSLDTEFSYALHLARELERTVEEFLEL